MKQFALIGIALTLGLSAHYGLAAGTKAVSEEQLGLSKTNVLDVPEPGTFQYRDNQPFSGQLLPRAYLGAPPQVPHDIQNFVPITRESNMCVGCHQQPDKIGQKIKGQPTPLPLSHYVDAKAGDLNMGRFVCTQCHTPQANVKPLVGNTFKPR